MQDFYADQDLILKREQMVRDRELPCRITLFQALPEGEKMNQIIRNAVELGVFQIVPVTARRAFALPEEEEKTKVREWNETARLEAEHAVRAFVPAVTPVLPFARAAEAASGFDRKFIPYEFARGMEDTREKFGQIRPGDSVAVFIGPENGFDEEEIACAKRAGILPVTLGHRILRTETAGMSVLSILMYLLEQEW